MGVMNVAFIPLEEVTDNAQVIFEKAKANIEETTLKENFNLPGLADQLKIQLDRLQPGKCPAGPDCEFILSPGVVIAIGESCCITPADPFTGLMNRTSANTSGKEVFQYHCFMQQRTVQRFDRKSRLIALIGQVADESVLACCLWRPQH